MTSLAEMAGEVCAPNCNWLGTGNEVFPAMLRAIEDAHSAVILDTYIYGTGNLGERFRAALIRAAERGVKVRVLVDGLSSYSLPDDFWSPLTLAGGEARVFNPFSLHRLSLRDHRKLLVCDEQIAFLGGFNIAPEYDGDGVTCGWCDIGLKLEGPLVKDLARSFDEMFAMASMLQKPLLRLRKARSKRAVYSRNEQLLLSGPGRGRSPIQRAFRRDLHKANSVWIIAAYFLPTWRLRRQLAAVARKGGEVQLMLAGKSDVAVSQLAGRSLYHRLLNAGVRIFEYQPQILHAKLVIIDNAVYVGSANFDLRSLHFNYELLIRFEHPEIAAQARTLFKQRLHNCREITAAEWKSARSLWERIKERWAYFLLVRVDPYFARRQWRALPD